MKIISDGTNVGTQLTCIGQVGGVQEIAFEINVGEPFLDAYTRFMPNELDITAEAKIFTFKWSETCKGFFQVDGPPKILKVRVLGKARSNVFVSNVLITNVETGEFLSGCQKVMFSIGASDKVANLIIHQADLKSIPITETNENYK